MDIQQIFKYHPPTEAQIPIYEEMRNEHLATALFIERNCPESEERTLALRALQQSCMWANAAIAIHSYQG